MLAGLLAAAGSYPTDAWAAALLRSASLDPAAGGATLVLALSAPRQPRFLVLKSPHRLVIDLPDTRQAGKLRVPASGPIRSVRGAARAHGGYRLVVELNARPQRLPRAASVATATGFQLRIPLGEAAPAAAALRTALDATPPAVVPVARTVQPAHGPGRAGRDIVVAVDAGHGGEDPGASGPAGTHEKDVTLAIARALAARLNARPGIRAVLTRDTDRLIDLRGRFERARNAHADLFVSIHADSVRDRGIAGASVYTLSYHGASSEAAKRLADRENATVLKGGVALADVDPQVRPILLDVAQSANMGASVEAAAEVLDALDGVGAVRKKIVQHAAFVVLKSPDVPSMLVETAYISNPAEERKLRSPAYQQRLAQAIESGVVSYFQRHPPDGTSYANARRAGSAGVATTVESDSGV
ncbi:MAG: N-acetylmuramoyl-L-alanine amidase [Gammaproteobacteria bacterium]|nr:N-acetylmuramoyl-L-alanine amidase [Gammaproteobacteria bacterium]